YTKGFSEFAENPACELDSKAFPRFSCKIIVDKVELPSAEQIQTVLTQAQQLGSTGGTSGGTSGGPATDPLSRLSGGSTGGGGGRPLPAGAGALASQFGIIKDVLEQGIRRITVQIIWHEGRAQRDMSLVAYYTDVRKVDQAIQV